MRNRGKKIHNRSAFTLIEMLVVIGIILVLATLSVAIIPSVQQRTKAARGADQVQGWLLIARERALRDRQPRGVRLLVDTPDPNGIAYIRSLVFIEQPDPFTGGTATLASTNMASTNIVAFSGVDVTGGQDPNQPALWPIQPGDYFQIQDGSSYQIQTVNGPNAPPGTPPNSIQTVYNIAEQPSPTTNYLITRSPRQTAGEETLLLPQDVVIDPKLSVPNIPSPVPPAPYYDIVFTPSGALTGTLGNGNGKIILWLRDLTKDYPLPPNPQNDTGDQPLLVIFSRTGRIGAVPFNTDPTLFPPGNPNLYPYYYALDPRSSGL
jgi:prepilin-type N-terminal cleavage/methylation domain-containing protein